MKTVYVLLTRTNTVLSRTIGKTTGDDFTHASLALDAELTRLYSFGRRFEHNPFLAGFVRESLTHGVFSWDDGIPCAVYALNVDDRVYAAVERRIRRMYELRRRYRYNLLGLLYNYAGRAHSRAYRYFCSEFVADTLQRTGALRLNMPPARMRPNDFAELPGLRLVYQGGIGGYAPDGDSLPAACLLYTSRCV